MLYGFGGFGLSEAPQFRPEVIAFLERGGVYATANIRGGGEYGHTWREAGMLEKKLASQNFASWNQIREWLRRVETQNGYCLTFDLSTEIQLEPARPCGVPGIAFKFR